MPAADTMQSAVRPEAPGAAPHARLAPWLRLQLSAGLGLLRARAVVEHYGGAAQVLAADAAELGTLLPGPVVRALRSPLPAEDAARLAEQMARLADWLAEPGNRVLALTDPDYPCLLRQLPDTPLLLYVQGRSELLHAPSLAVVGSRTASAQGVANAERFACALSQAGLTIVSGLALGIDAAAHRGGLRGAGSSVAVIGTGADRTYPPRNHALARELATQGCIVSEYWLGTGVSAKNFPRRNRLISGLARGVLVVEAAARSGSLITANLANDQGREVFAIPGSIHAALSKGCHHLIKQGAKLVETADDVLVELRYPVAPVAGAPAAPESASLAQRDQATLAVLAALGDDPADADQLALRCAMESGQVAAALLALELDGVIERLPGAIYQRSDR